MSSGLAKILRHVPCATLRSALKPSGGALAPQRRGPLLKRQRHSIPHLRPVSGPWRASYDVRGPLSHSINTMFRASDRLSPRTCHPLQLQWTSQKCQRTKTVLRSALFSWSHKALGMASSSPRRSGGTIGTGGWRNRGMCSARATGLIGFRHGRRSTNRTGNATMGKPSWCVILQSIVSHRLGRRSRYSIPPGPPPTGCLEGIRRRIGHPQENPKE